MFECIGGLVLEHPSVINVLTCPKRCKSMEKQNFTRGFTDSTLDNARRRPFLSDLKSQDCMLDHCLPILVILAIILKFPRQIQLHLC